MKKIVKFLTAFVIFLFIFAACSGGGSKQECIADTDNENESNGDTDGEKNNCENDSDSENTDEDTEEDEYKGDGTEQFVTLGYAYSPDSTCERGEPESGEDEYEEKPVYPDIYKIDGDILWLASKDKGLTAVDIHDPKNLKLLGFVRFQGIVKEIYFKDDVSYVVVVYPSTEYSYDSGEIYSYTKSYSKIIAVDIKDPENMSILSTFEIKGEIVGSVQTGDVIYAASLEKGYSWNDCSGDSGYGGLDRVAVISINVKDPGNIKQVYGESADGADFTTVYVSQKAVYAAEAYFYAWNHEHTFGYPIIRFDISDPEGEIIKKTNFSTKGYLNAAWTMKEKDGVLYTVTTSDNWGGTCIVESFDVGDPENIEQIDYREFLWSNGSSPLSDIIFDGDRIYALTTFFPKYPPLVIDISDPAYIRLLGELKVPENTYKILAVKNNKFLAGFSYYNYETAKIAMYDAEDPENPKEINTVTIKKNSRIGYTNDEFYKKAFKVYDEAGLILYPYLEDFSSARLQYKLHLIDFDQEKGLKTRGFIDSRNEMIYGIAVNDLIFSVGEKHLSAVDAADRDNPKIMHQISFAPYFSSTAKCGKSLCVVKDSEVEAYNGKTDERIWKSTPFSDKKNSNDDITLLKNRSYAYIFKHTDLYYPWDEFTTAYYVSDEESETENFTPYVKIVKLGEESGFEETGEFPFKADTSYKGRPVLSDNNALSMFAIKYGEFDEEGNRPKEPKIKFFDLNSPEKGINAFDFDFDYDNLSCGHNIFATENTFWTSGCKRKKAKENEADEFFCYALPFDAGDPANPKAGKRINIPGELVGISENGKYLYTTTPRTFRREDHTGTNWKNIDSFDFYILKLNEDKNGVTVVKQETFDDSYSSINSKLNTVLNSFFIKNDKVFFIKDSTGADWSQCRYRNDAHYDIRLVSSESGKELYHGSFENIMDSGSVKDGGIILKTTENLIYIDENGKSKHLASPADMSGMILSEAQLLDGRINIPAGNYGFYSFDVK